ncbi:hypothetical protein GCM10027589_52020 [Actinocorallia lasiicapitis]
MDTALALASGLLWTATYVLIILVGFRERTYGMPIVALGANLSWEFIFSFVRPHDGMQLYIDYLWLALDAVILVTVVRFGPGEFKWLPRWAFLPGLAATLAITYLGVDAVSRQFDQGLATFAAFGQNLLMSGLFLSFLMVRRSLRGQSVAIAVCKGLGTVCASGASWIWLADEPERHGPVLPYLFVTIALVDLLYIVAPIAVKRSASAAPDSA